jgi:hypothetical protein
LLGLCRWFHQPSSFEQREHNRLVPGVVLPQFRPWIIMPIGSAMLVRIQPIVAAHGTADREAAYRLKAGGSAPAVHFVFSA